MPNRFTPADAARLATSTPVHPLTPAQARVVARTAVLWCRGLQPPTVRAVGNDLGFRSSSTVLNGFLTFEEVVAAVISTEAAALVDGWFGQPLDARLAWLSGHARALADVDVALLRLPALVHAALASAGALPPERPDPSPLYLLMSAAEGPLSADAAA